MIKSWCVVDHIMLDDQSWCVVDHIMLDDQSWCVVDHIMLDDQSWCVVDHIMLDDQSWCVVDHIIVPCWFNHFCNSYWTFFFSCIFVICLIYLLLANQLLLSVFLHFVRDSIIIWYILLILNYYIKYKIYIDFICRIVSKTFSTRSVGG